MGLFGCTLEPLKRMSLIEVLSQARESGEDPVGILSSLLDRDISQVFPEHTPTQDEVWRLLFDIIRAKEELREPIVRDPIDSLDEVAEMVKKASKVVIILGAGGSVGPDFRSPGGLYDSIAKENVLEDPCDVFDLNYFNRDPSIFWRFAHTIFPKESPDHSSAHYFIEKLEKAGKLQRVYSQNVDTLERGVPEEKLCCVHGSWRKNKCVECGEDHDIDFLRPYVEQKIIPVCKKCKGSIKPGIVFFGQATNLNESDVRTDCESADLLIVIGTSLRVAPISDLPNEMYKVPSILINRAPVTCEFNAQLLGECSDVIEFLEEKLGWKQPEDRDIEFVEPNTFVFPSDNILATRVIETPRNRFLVTSSTCDVSDLD